MTYLYQMMKVVLCIFSTTHSSSPQHPMRKIGNRRHVPSLLNPHSPLRLDLLKDKSLPWLSFFLLKAPCPKLIHNAFQSVGVSVFATGLYVIMCIGFWQRLVMFKLSGSGLPWFLWPCLNIHNVTPEPCMDTQCSHWVVLTHNVTPKLLLGSL